MDDFSYSPVDQTETFGTGNKLSDLDRNLADLNRVMAYGVVGDIGTGGQIASGGLGPLPRLLGLASDQVISVECVLGDGSVVIASADEDPDLFFAVRGAAWSFCIMTDTNAIFAATECCYGIPVQHNFRQICRCSRHFQEVAAADCGSFTVKLFRCNIDTY